MTAEKGKGKEKKRQTESDGPMVAGPNGADM